MQQYSQTASARMRVAKQSGENPVMQESFRAPASNSAMLAWAQSQVGDHEQTEPIALEQMMSARMQRFRDHQRPDAEREADSIASSLGNLESIEDVKAELGSRLGADFSGVRFHTDAESGRRAESIGAQAYTSGRDIYFARGEFSPELAAHELVHTAQQGMVESSMPTVSAPAGEVQMNPFKTLWRGLKKAGTAISEFLGGKMGLIGPGKSEKQDAFTRAKQGDFSDADIVDKDKMQTLVDAKKTKMLETLGGEDDFTKKYGGTASRSLNPVNRKAMSQMIRDKSIPQEQRDKISQSMEDIDQRMMIDTIRGPGQEEKDRLLKHYKNRKDQKRLVREYGKSKSGKMWLGDESKTGTLQDREDTYNQTIMEAGMGKRSNEEAQRLADEKLAQSKASGDALLRTMFLMQLGQFNRKDTKTIKPHWYNKKKKVSTETEWEDTMANAFSHGGRTAFLFNGTENKLGGKSSDDVANSIFGQNMGHDAGLHTRAAGTHHLSVPKVGEGKKGYKEKSGIKAAMTSKFDKSYQHFGMDMAIGGIGRKGVAGRGGRSATINADGRSGHMYIGKRSSTLDEKGALLMGLESDSPYRMNQTGHMHNAAATPEEGSSTGGLKTDIKGDKYGGRTVDLSGLENSELIGVLDQFSQHVDTLRDDPNKKEEYEALLKKMTGKRLDDDSMQDFMMSFMSSGENEGDDAKRKRMGEMLKRSRQRK